MSRQPAPKPSKRSPAPRGVQDAAVTSPESPDQLASVETCAGESLVSSPVESAGTPIWDELTSEYPDIEAALL